MGRTIELAAGDLTVEIAEVGAAIHRVLAPDREGRRANVVLGLPGAEPSDAHYGAVVGRYANRIAGGAFTLDGTRYELPRNDGENTLHGGPEGFDGRTWTVAAEEADLVELRLESLDGDMGFPGRLEVSVAYALSADGALRLDYRARTDRPTVVNLTNHSYWNLAGEGSGWIGGHLLQVAASRFVPAGADHLPTGELAPVDGTPFDFREPTAVGARLRDGHPQLAAARGYDHSLLVDGWDGSTLVEAARVEEPQSGRVLEVATTEPAVHVYSGNYLDATEVGTGDRIYRQTDGLALETQHLPDSPNRSEFPSTVLRPGEELRSTTVFRLSAH